MSRMPPGVSLMSRPPARAAPRGQLLADALARLRDRLHRAEIERALVDQRLDELQQRRAGLAARPPKRAP